MTQPKIKLEALDTTEIADARATKSSYLFGHNDTTTTGLTFGYFGGVMLVDGTLTTIANGTAALTLSETNYVEATRAGVVSANIVGFTAGSVPLFTVVTGVSTITSVVDNRASIQFEGTMGRLSLSVAGDSNVTLTASQSRNSILNFTGALTGNIDVVVPVGPKLYVVSNNTTGAFTLTVKTAGTGVIIPQGETQSVVADGTNVVRVAPPPPAPTTPTESFIITVGDETTAITTGTSKVTFRMPYAFTLTGIRGSLSTAQTSGSIFTVDVNEGGTTILSTKLTIDNTAKTSTTATTPLVISDSSLADDAEITIDVDQVGDGTATGLKIVLIGTKV